MKHTLLRFLLMTLIFPSAVAMSDVLELPFVKDNAEVQVRDQQIFSTQCSEMAWKYSERIKKVSQKEQSSLNDAPLLVFKSTKEGQEVKTLVHGKVVTKNGEKYVEITQSFFPYGNAQTITLKAPNSEKILNLPAVPGGKALQLHISSTCAKVADAKAEVDFQCGDNKNIKREEAHNLKVTDTSYQNNLLEHFPHMADYHQKNVGNKAKLTKPYERGINECLNSEQKVSFDRGEVFKKFFPNATFKPQRGGNGGGFGGGTTSAKVVSR